MNEKKKYLISSAFALAVLALLFLPGLLRGYTVNRADKETELTVPEKMNLYSGDKLGFSFQFPAGLSTSWSPEDGAYVYCGETGQAPYILVCRTDKRGMSPEKYFKACDKFMVSGFDKVESTPIQEVELGGKTLYMTRYQCSAGGTDYVIDRYVELYGSFYIQYSSVSHEAGSLNTELYYAAETLRVRDGAYAGAYSPKLALHRDEANGFSVKLPEMLATKELTVGFFSSGENAVMICVLCTQDDNGKAIYNRQDFIDRAAASPEFVAGLLGADSASFSEGRELSLGGRSFYSYPMLMSSAGQDFSGALCLANAGETGCWLICYAVRDGCPEHDKTLALCESCAQSVKFD